MNEKIILLITTEYPNEKSKDENNIIHLHMKEYKKNGFKVEVICVNENNKNLLLYELEDIYVRKTKYEDLRSILMSRTYDVILVYGLNSQIFEYLKTSYIKNTAIIEIKKIEERSQNYNKNFKDIENFYEMELKKTNNIEEEIKYINEKIVEPSKIIKKIGNICDNPILTIAIPAYNAEKVLHKCLQSLLSTEFLNLTQILVINDGSKDKTADIGKIYEDLTTVNGKSIVKVINKENGGHGSGINKGIELAKGKYFKVIDADDWVNEEEYNELIKRLIHEDSDLILTDFCEARSFENKPKKIEYYKNLKENRVYHFDEICNTDNGFEKWGPMLPTATYKLELLKKANFKLLEKTFYVDMIYNAYSIIYIDTVKKYDLDIYRYYIGNEGQSVSEEGMKRNYKNHEDVTIELMKIVEEDKRFSKNKREYVLNKLCLPMVYVQYYINLELFRSRKKFLIFENRTKKYKNLMNYPEFNTRIIKFHRYTKGIFIKITPFIRRQIARVRSVLSKMRTKK